MQSLMPFVIVFGGAFSLAGAIQDWDFFMESRRARLLVSMFGRDGARVFYGLVGVILIVGGVVVIAR
jgi:hypothetical protein